MICKRCGEEIWLDRSDTGPGGYLGNPPIGEWPPQLTLCCDGTQLEHEPEGETQ